jgi:hypothetical protein
MKKNILIKGILVLIAIALLTMGFTGCGPVIATTGTVYIYIYGTCYYDIYMDNIGRFWGASPYYTYALYNVPIGTHYFEASDIHGWWWGYDDDYQYIGAGVNYVYLYP